jgi:hypothetical protein
MRIQKFIYGNISFTTTGDLYTDKMSELLDKVMKAIRTNITEAFVDVKAQARVSTNKNGESTIYFYVRYEDVDRNREVYDIVKNTLDKECKKIYDDAVAAAASAGSSSSGSSGGSGGFGAVPVGGSSSGTSGTTTPTVPTGTITGNLVADYSIVRYTAETIWSDMIEDPMCEVRLKDRVTYNVNETGSCSMSVNNAPIVWSKNKMELIRKTVDVMCNHFMDSPEVQSDYETLSFTMNILDWTKSFSEKDMEHKDWCVKYFINQLKELNHDYDDIFNMDIKINDDYNATNGTITGVIKVPGAISDQGLQRRIEDIRRARQAIKIKDRTEDTKYRLLDIDIAFSNGKTLEYRTDANAPSMSKFFYKKDGQAGTPSTGKLSDKLAGGLGTGSSGSGKGFGKFKKAADARRAAEAKEKPKKKWMKGLKLG